MSSMMDTAQMDHGSTSGVAHFTQNAPTQRIKRIGGRPIVFEGSELAMAMSYTPTVAYWYEVNLYRTTDQRFVATCRLFFQSSEEQDTVRAWECKSLDEAIEKLATYDAAHDVKIGAFAFDASSPASEMAAHAMELGAQIKGHRQHYESLIGEFLYEIEKGK